MGRINGSVSQRSDSYSFYIDWSESEVSTANNTSVVSATAYVYCSKHTAYATGQSQSLTIDGTNFTSSISINLSPGVTVTLISGSKTITHNSDGKKSVTISASCDLPDGNGWGPAWGSASGTATLSNIPRQANINSAPNFNDEQNPTITYTNSAGNSVSSLQACISLTGASADVPYRDINKTGSSYTFNLTTAERNTLRNATTGNSRNVVFYVKTVIGGVTYYSTLTRTLSIVNGNPTFSTFNYVDTGSVSIQLTGNPLVDGNSKIVINNFNIMRITIPVANKATAIKGATMSKYRAICGNLSDEESYSSSEDVVLWLPYIKDRTITVYAIDSRGNSTAVSKPVEEWINYTNPVMSASSVERTGGVNTETTLRFNGTFFKTQEQYDFGAQANEITKCVYQFKKTNESTYGNEISIIPTINANEFFFNATIYGDAGVSGADGFELTNSYDIKVTIQDKLGEYTQIINNLLLGAGNPVMAIHKNGAAFGLPYDTTLGGSLQAEGKKVGFMNYCASFKLGTTTTISKSGTWGGVQFPMKVTNFNYGGIFELKNDKVYCKKTAIIRVSYLLLVNGATSNYYTLLGRNR